MIIALLVLFGIPMAILYLIGVWCDRTAGDENGQKRRLLREEASRQAEARALQLEQERANLRAAHDMARQRELERQAAYEEIVNALETIASAPDFRRPAAVIHKCGVVSPVVRQQLFHKYRHAILRHAVACLQRRIDPKHLARSTQDLVAALAADAFEAEYLMLAAAEAIAVSSAPPRTVSFTDEIQRELQFHQERLWAITHHLDDPDLRKRLDEAERTRHANALLRLTDRAADSSGIIFTL